MNDFKACPWCGGYPHVSEPEWRDDNRYYALDVICCAVMEIAIGWRIARDLPDSQKNATLMEKALTQWNTRNDPHYVCTTTTEER